MSPLQAVRLQMTSKTATVQYKPVTSLTGNSNARAHYEQSPGYDQTSHALPNIHGLYGCSYISIYSLNTGKLPGHFSYKWPGYEASVNYDYATVRNTAVVQFCGKKYAKFLGKSRHITEQIYNFTQP